MEPKFKIGDRVKSRHPLCGETLTGTVTIVRGGSSFGDLVLSNTYRVLWDNGDEGEAVRESYLCLLTRKEAQDGV